MAPNRDAGGEAIGKKENDMTLKELLSLEEETPCPGCLVCKPRASRTPERRRPGGRLASRVGDNNGDGVSRRSRV